MIKEAIQTLLALLNSGGERVIMLRDTVRQGGNYLLFSSLQKEGEISTLHFSLFIAGHTFLGNAEALIPRLSAFLEMLEELRANPLPNYPSKLSVQEAHLKEVNTLFFYEVSIKLEIRQ